jgi:hypothetical protein
MTERRTLPTHELNHSDAAPQQWEDYLTPEQRVAVIADILSTIALRILKEEHEDTTIIL